MTAQKLFSDRAIFVWPGRIVSVSVRYLFYQAIAEKIKTWPLRFPTKETHIWRRHSSTGQSCYSMTSKRSIDWFLQSSSGMKFFSATRSLNQPKAKPRTFCIRSTNQSNRFISVRLFFLSCSRVFISRSHENALSQRPVCYFRRMFFTTNITYQARCFSSL